MSVYFIRGDTSTKPINTERKRQASCSKILLSDTLLDKKLLKMRGVLLVLAATSAVTLAANEKKIVCYWGSWSVYRHGDGQFDLSYVDPKLCTHMIYTFIGLSDNGEVKILDPGCDLPDNGGKDNYNRFNKLREQNPALKTMIAIGGWKEGSAVYSRVTADPHLRQKMVESIVNFVKKYKFDGFDVDWEYPAQRENSSPADKENYVLLLKELRERFDQEGLILSAAVGASEGSASQSYNIPEISKYLDFINLMVYDLHGSWENKIGMHSAVYAASSESGGDAKLNVDAIIKYWLSQGAPAEKLILGVPFYGKSFTASNPQSNSVGAPASAGTAGPYTQEAGMLGYNEICENIKNDNWKVEYDEERKAAYAYKDNQWVSYDDEKILKEKTDYIKKHNLGGAMVWSIETDDFHGKCGNKWPLLNVLNNELGNGASSTSNSTLKPEVESTAKQSTTQIQASQESQETQQPQVIQKPQQSEQQESSGKICQTDGFTRDPQDCSKFIFCQSVDGKFVEHRYSCPPQLVYDSLISTCNRPENVQC